MSFSYVGSVCLGFTWAHVLAADTKYTCRRRVTQLTAHVKLDCARCGQT
jgi:hypothetical protein